MAKYAERRYVLHKEDLDPYRVCGAVKTRDLTALLQLYAEGEDLAKPTALPEGQVRPAVCPAGHPWSHLDTKTTSLVCIHIQIGITKTVQAPCRQLKPMTIPNA